MRVRVRKTVSKLTVASILVCASLPSHAFAPGEGAYLSWFFSSPYLTQLVESINKPIIQDINKKLNDFYRIMLKGIMNDRQDRERIIQLLSQAQNTGGKAGAQAQIQASVSIAEFAETQKVKREAAKMVAEMKQPSNICQNIRTASDLDESSDVRNATVEDVVVRQDVLGKQAAADKSSAVLRAYTAAMSEFATEKDKLRGLAVDQDTMAGEDMNAANLYGSAGSETRLSKMDGASDAAITHLSGTLNTPEELLNPEWETTPKGQEYAMLTRVYMAGANLSSYALASISARHEEQAFVFEKMQGRGLVKPNAVFNGGQPEFGVADGAISPVAPIGKFDVNASVRWIMANSADKWNRNLGFCWRAVKQAMTAGGLPPVPLPYIERAYMGHKALVAIGFQAVSGPYQAGDIAIFDKVPGKHDSGHAQMYTGSIWVSDFKQRTFYPWPDHQGYTVYRYTGQK